MNADDCILLKLNRKFVLEVVEDLEVCIRNWEATRDYVGGDYAPDDVALFSCSSEEEAQSYVDYYRQIRDEIVGQLATRVG